LFPSQVEEAHEFHMSKCIIEFVPQQQSFQIMMHLFLDDFELALAGKEASDLKLCTDFEKEGADEIITKYLKENFLLKINKENVTYNYIGKENSEDLIGVWIYLEVENIAEVKSVEIANSILTKEFDDQKNLVQIKVPGAGPGTLIMSKKRNIESINF